MEGVEEEEEERRLYVDSIYDNPLSPFVYKIV